jgi:ubiquitin-conjugating enzyme (huntingtin interacting protein 2)
MSSLLSIYLLLCSPEPNVPLDAEVAGMQICNPTEFEHVARNWAIKYAGAPKMERVEGTGGAMAESIKRKAQHTKGNEEKKAKLAE